MTAYRVQRHRPEYVEQSAVVNLYGSIGASVYVNSVYGAHPKGVTPGIPDMRVKQPDWRLEWDHETKPAGKRQSKAQYDYMRECQAMGMVYVLGGLQEALDWLDFLGILERRNDIVEFKPRELWRNTILAHRYGRSSVVNETGWGGTAPAWYASEAFARQLGTFGYKPSAK